ncbi:MAG: carbonic anhydrase [Bacteroidia bacterium]|nr:carbonic anhydrase [Bacteroidia bacterium]
MSTPTNQMTWNEALDRLKSGNNRFVQDSLDGELNDSSRRQTLTGGQHPYAIILSCADSRVVPELAFDTGLGEIFVIRVAGNVANVESIASIEYAVAHLGTNLIVVLGHESCGAVTAAMQGGNNGYNLNLLLAHINPAIANTESGVVNDVVKTNARMTGDELEERSGIIKGAVEAGTLKIVPAYYNLGTGKVDFME